MRINKLSVIGIISGSVLMLSSWIRYFIIYPDLDKAIIYGTVGVLIIAVAYLYDRLRQAETSLLAVEEYIQDKYLEERESDI